MLWELYSIIILLAISRQASVAHSIQNGETQTLELHKLRNYLRAFGYLNDDATGDEKLLESALRTFQRTHHLNATGKLDSDTINLINTPRCGVPDNHGSHLVSNPKEMKHNESHGHGVHIGSHYTFFVGLPKWPPTKHYLTYRFDRGAQSRVGDLALMFACAQAFQLWGKVSNFTFQLMVGPSSQQADLSISFQRGDHGNPFDGPGKILAHSYAPTDGRLHVDADENWSIRPPSAGEIDLVWVATHEIGHLLGLQHSTVSDAIMYAYVQPGKTRRDLHSDDIAGIRALYSQP